MVSPVPQKLTGAQMTLLELFSFEMSEAEVLAMRQTLMQHFRQRLEDESERAMQKKGLTTAQFEAQLNVDDRTERLHQIRVIPDRVTSDRAMPDRITPDEATR